MNSEFFRKKLAYATAFIWALTVSSSSFAINFKGKVFDQEGDPNSALFSFERTERSEGSKRIVEGKFFEVPGNQIAVHEKLTYSQGATLFERYEFERPMSKESAVVEIRDGKIFFTYTDNGKKEENKEKLEENTINRDELVPFVKRNWDTLMRGEKLKSRFVLPDRAETIGFGLRKRENVTERGIAAIRVVMFALSPFVAAVAGDTFLTFEAGGEHRLLKVEGRTPVLKRIGNAFKTLHGRIEFLY